MSAVGGKKVSDFVFGDYCWGFKDGFEIRYGKKSGLWALNGGGIRNGGGLFESPFVGGEVGNTFLEDILGLDLVVRLEFLVGRNWWGAGSLSLAGKM